MSRVELKITDNVETNMLDVFTASMEEGDSVLLYTRSVDQGIGQEGEALELNKIIILADIAYQLTRIADRLDGRLSVHASSHIPGTGPR